MLLLLFVFGEFKSPALRYAALGDTTFFQVNKKAIEHIYLMINLFSLSFLSVNTKEQILKRKRKRGKK